MRECSGKCKSTTDHCPLQEQPYPDAPPLPTAAWHGQVEKVKKLIKEGADLNQRGPNWGKTAPQAPLALAIGKAS